MKEAAEDIQDELGKLTIMVIRMKKLHKKLTLSIILKMYLYTYNII
ncbi:MAG: hypothetical protein SPG30_07390 [Peptostreptococcus porci]|nr:hypothetical protein [Peptostreptococcus porci]